MTTTSRGCGAGYDYQLLQRMSLLSAQSGHFSIEFQCPLLGDVLQCPLLYPKQTWTAAIGRISKLAKAAGAAWRIAYGFAASNFFSGWAKEQQLRSQTQHPEGPGRCGSLDAGGRHGRTDFPSELLRLLFAA